MIDRRKIGICLFLFSIPFICEFFSFEAKGFHTVEELQYLRTADIDTLFLTSAWCQQCHGYDTAQIASVTAEGDDVNLFDDWKVSMMANAAKDPFWRAKVSHEVLVNPNYQLEIETKCTSCHAPLGHYTALQNQQDHYTIEDMLGDSLALDGVSCLACHQQTDDLNLGFNHSGELHFDSAKVAYGPFENPLASPMLIATQFEPKYSAHISDAGLCAGCHTLITTTFDLDGEPTGGTFVEQATYHEWLNSSYEVNNVTCQNCHLPALEGQFFLINGLATPPRSPFYLHSLVGGNSTMLKLMKNNKEALDIDATDEQFDEAIEATHNLLEYQTLELDLSFLDRTPDTTFLELNIINKAGHKFPSGYPARRAYVSFLVETIDGDTLFHSGKTDDTFEVFGQDEPFEPHHQTITSEEQVQIYEMVMADVAGNFTTILDRADHFLKDNRLVPEGFSISHSTYDTTQLVGLVLSDPDFNLDNSIEGSGNDRLNFNIPTDNYHDILNIQATVYYQSIPPKFMVEMFAESTPEIELFKNMFDEADRSPVLIQEKNLEVDAIMVGTGELQVSANFVDITGQSNELVFVKADKAYQVSIYDAHGKLHATQSQTAGDHTLTLPAPTGIYFIQFLDNSGALQVEKFIHY